MLVHNPSTEKNFNNFRWII